MAASEYQTRLEELRNRVETMLSGVLSGYSWPENLKKAAGYSLMAGGKRLRPILTLLAAEICDGDISEALPAACAIEMVHTYSLIHDDLPSMDDDDFRRGKPTCHKVFGEALAILAGDCLLTAAFEMVTTVAVDSARTAEMVRLLAIAAGGSGMVGGQVLDLEAEKQVGSLPENSWNSRPDAVYRPDASENSPQISIFDPDLSQINRVEHLTQIHTMKTGVLIAASLELGAVCAGGGDTERSRLRQYGRNIGLAFQIADDLLDVTGDNRRLGKTTGRDADLGKLTYPSLLGIEESRQQARILVDQACDQLEPFGEKNFWLRELARFIVERDH